MMTGFARARISHFKFLRLANRLICRPVHAPKHRNRAHGWRLCAVAGSAAGASGGASAAAAAARRSRCAATRPLIRRASSSRSASSSSGVRGRSHHRT